MPPLSAQLEYLVNAYHGGNINEAARDVGVAQPTLARLLGRVGGRPPNPSAAVLRLIADHYEASIDWLLTGEGRGPGLDPAREIPGADVLRWRSVLRRLQLPRDVLETWLLVPGASWRAARLGLPGGYQLFSSGHTITAAMRAAFRAGYDEWVAFMNAVIEAKGEVAARRFAIGEAPAARLGFSHAGMDLLRGKISLADVSNFADEQASSDASKAGRRTPPARRRKSR